MKRFIETLNLYLNDNAYKKKTHPIKVYTGKYHAKGFGEIEIIEEGNKLFAVLPTFKFQLEHLNYNTFYLKGTNGEISLLKLYSQKEPIEFNKE